MVLSLAIGQDWTPTSAPQFNWGCLASSAHIAMNFGRQGVSDSEVPLEADYEKHGVAQINFGAATGDRLSKFAQILVLPAGEDRGFRDDLICEAGFAIKTDQRLDMVLAPTD